MPTRALNKDGIEGVGCLHVVSGAANEMYIKNGDDELLVNKKVTFKEEKGIEQNGLVKNGSCMRNICCSDESSSSSIGKNSDLSENSLNEKSLDGEEVQSSYKGPLDAMESLEEVLPIRRGISRFYNGKSKSFASLADASSSSSSIKDIAKPENAYMRKRRNLLACSLAWDKTRASPLRGNNSGGISKRVNNNTSKTTLALAVAMTKASEDDSKTGAACYSVAGPLLVSGSSRKEFSPWRSFSMADLQQCASISNKLATKPS